MKKSKKSKIEFNDQFQKALDLMERTSRNVFVTGRAGTGKSTLLNYFRANTEKKVAVLAPTGVAAVNINGQTIHSFFGFKPDVTFSKIKKMTGNRKNLYKNIDAIIIDEVSMARADLLDCVDKFLRLNGKNKKLPFGGIQMIFIGDLYQLPPVITARDRDIFKNHYETGYFLSSHVFSDFEMDFVELEKIYRQKDQKFIDILNCIRNNSVEAKELDLLNERFDPDFDPKADDFYIYLVPTNDLARKINEEYLRKVKGKTYYFEGKIDGNFDEKYLPTETNLSLKIGSQVMLLNNDSQGRWINGSIGKVVGIETEKEYIAVEFESGETEMVRPYTWSIYSYSYDIKKKILETEIIGSVTQYPLKLAWAITIHKSQGKTFEKVIIDMGRGAFAHGQTYVALSRCVSLEGLILKKEIKKSHIFIDWKVVQFVTKYQYKISEQRMPLEKKIEIIEKAIQNNKKLKIVYLKAKDEKSKRIILPSYVGELEYNGIPFLGVEAFCHARGRDRVFKVDRILEIEEA
jgi:ATP-dependent DNA helicase PIF1